MSTEPKPESPAELAAVTDAMIDAYLQANDAYWRKTDESPKPPGKWRTGNVHEATRVSLLAALATIQEPVAFDLSDEAIWQNERIMVANKAAGLPMPVLGLVVRAVAEAIAATQARPASGEAWISVDERLPENNVNCLVFFEGEFYGIAGLRIPHKGRMLWHGHGGSHNSVTHWQPLAAPTSTPSENNHGEN